MPKAVPKQVSVTKPPRRKPPGGFNRRRIDITDTKRAAEMLRSELIDRLDRSFMPDHPLGRLILNCETGIIESGYSKVDFMQAIQIALFPEAFLPDEDIEEMIREARNNKHKQIAGIMPGSTRRHSGRLWAFLSEMTKREDDAAMFAKASASKTGGRHIVE